MRSSRRRSAAALALLPALVAACVSTPGNPPLPTPATAPPAPPPLEASYDWHGLLLVPFGSVLKAIPFTLHEVLLFRDASRPAQADEAECYAMERTAPRFVARTPSEYMLCFKHDRLARVQVTVSLPQSEAAQIFSDACNLWRRHAAAGQAAAGAPGADQPAAAEPAASTPLAEATPQAPGACDGRDGGISYAGRLDQDETQTDASLTVSLDAAVQP